MGYFNRIFLFWILVATLTLIPSGIAANTTNPAPGSIDPGTINLATGDLSFPLNLVSIPGRQGLDISLSITYNSNIQNIVDTWNMDAPTGVLGLGWSFPENKVIRDSKGTGTGSDDTYYLISEGENYELIQTSATTDSTSATTTFDFRTKNKFTLLQIQYVTSTSIEQWTIIDEDGTSYIYGGDFNLSPASSTTPLSDGNSIEWGIKWGNWIGTSVESTGQEAFPVGWNLYQIQNAWGDAITFTYDADLSDTSGKSLDGVFGTVGSGSAFYTKASYLSSITGPANDTVEIYYKAKDDFEYTDPHQEQSEPDAYQERFEIQYMDQMIVKNKDGELLYYVVFSYDNLGTLDDFKKRLLTSITYLNPSNNKLAPPYRFSYWGEDDTDGVGGVTQDATTSDYLYDLFDDSTGALYGALKTVTSPAGAIATYTYAQNEISNAARSLENIPPPDVDDEESDWNSPRAYFGSDYTVVIWEKSDDTQIAVEVYQWFGRWLTQDLGEYTVADPANVKVSLQQDFFVLATPKQDQSVHFFAKDPLQPGSWIVTDKSDTIASTTVQLVSGNNFAVVLDESDGSLYRYTWNGAEWNKYNPYYLQMSSASGITNVFFICAKNNFFVTLSAASDNSFTPSLRLNWLENGSWQTSICDVDNFFDPAGIVSDSYSIATYSGIKSGQMVAGKSFVALQVYATKLVTYTTVDTSSDTYYLYNTYTFTWSEDFTWPTDFSDDKSKEVSFADTGMVFSLTVIDDLVTLQTTDDDQQTNDLKIAWRFNGVEWTEKNDIESDRVELFAAPDMTLEIETSWGTKDSQLMQYDPNTGDWSEKTPTFSGTDITFYQSIYYFLTDWTYLGLSFFFELEFVADFVFGTAWDYIVSLGAPVEGFTEYALQGQNYFFIDDSIYYESPDGTWSSIDTVISTDNELYYSIVALASDFVVYMVDTPGTAEVLDLDGQTDTIDARTLMRNYIAVLKNGSTKDILTLESSGTTEAALTTYPSASQSMLTAGNMFIAYPRQSLLTDLTDMPYQGYSVFDDFNNATEFNLYRVINDDITGAMTDYVVSVAQVDDGYTSVDTYYDYETSTAEFDPTGVTAFYNKVTVIPGTNDGTDKTNGFTEYYFFNGHDFTDSTTGLPPNADTDSVQLCTDITDVNTCTDSTATNYSLVTGLLYYHNICNNDNDTCDTAAFDKTSYAVCQQTLSSTDFTAYQVLPVTVTTALDGIQTQEAYTYNANGLLASETRDNYNLDGSEDVIVTNYTYGSDQYSDLATLNILTPVVKVETTVNAVATAYTITAWQNWDTVGGHKWEPYRTFVALNNDPGNFDWTTNTPVTIDNWQLTSEITERNVYGITTEFQDVDGIVHAVIYDTTSLYPLASFAHASVAGNAAYYFGFESYEDPGDLQYSSGVITTDDSHSGESSLTSITGSADDFSIMPSSFSPRGGEQTPYVVSAWVKPADSTTCGCGFGTSVDTTIGDGEWTYIEYVTDNPSSSELPTVYCNAGGAIDDFRFGPVDSPFSAIAYDPTFFEPTASIGTNGGLNRTVYDSYRRPIIGIGPGEQVLSVSVSAYSRLHNSDEFNSSDPNQLVTIAARSGGVFYDFDDGLMTGWSGDGAVVDGAIQLIGANEAVLTQVNDQDLGANYGMRAIITQGDPSNSFISVSIGSATVKQDVEGDTFNLYDGTDLIDTTTVSWATEWVLVTIGARLLFYGDQALVFDTTFDTGEISGELQLSTTGTEYDDVAVETGTGNTFFDNIAVFVDPIISVNYTDGLGRNIQHQFVQDENTTIVGETLYDGWGNAAVHTRLAALDGSLAFRPGFVFNPDTLDDDRTDFWSSVNDPGIMTGEIADYFNAGGGGNIADQSQDDYQYPYSRQVFESNPLIRVIEEGFAGDDFKIGSSHSHTFSYQSDQSSLMTTVGIPTNQQTNFYNATVNVPYDSSTRIPLTTITDQLGRVAARQNGANNALAISAFSYAFATDGTLSETIYHPNYYSTIASHDQYTMTNAHNYSGSLQQQTTPDSDATQAIYDKAGRRRFVLDAEGAAQDPDRVRYWQYDDLGRVVEEGTVNFDWDFSTLQDYAYNEPDWPAEDMSPPQIITVTTTDDVDTGACSDDDCSLREAIAAANAGDTVSIPEGTYTLTQGTALTISTDISLVGESAADTIIQAAANADDAQSRVFYIDGSAVTLSSLTIRYGRTTSDSTENSGGSGGGIYVTGGQELTLDNVIISTNFAENYGGGIYNDGSTITLNNSTVAGNSLSDGNANGGGIYNDYGGTINLNNCAIIDNEGCTAGGGIFNHDGATMVLSNCTVSGNGSVDDDTQCSSITGVGICNNGILELISSTIANNNSTGSGATGGGITNSGTLTASGSIISNNSVTGDGNDCYAVGSAATMTSSGYNLIGDGSFCTFTEVTGDQVGTAADPIDAQFDVLGNYGGSSETLALLSSSPAIDAGGSDCPETDQRDVSRPQGTACDIGAYEYDSVTLTVTKPGDTNDGSCDDDCSLREAIAVASTGSAIMIPSDTYTLSLGELTLDKDIVLIGSGYDNTIIKADGTDRVFYVTSSTSEISDVTIRDGAPSADTVYGGGIYVKKGATLTINDCLITNNSADIGGGIYNGGTLTLNRCLVENNVLSIWDNQYGFSEPSPLGGGIYNSNILVLNDSSISGNGNTTCDGGGIINYGESTLNRSTISGNSSASGGGICNSHSTITLNSCTISNNEATYGGGITSWGGTLTIIDSTIAFNTYHAGALYMSGGNLYIENSIISNNVCTKKSDMDTNYYTKNITAQSLGHNLISDGNDYGFPGTSTDLIGSSEAPIDALLDTLQNNGGYTNTLALLTGSPAIDAGGSSCADTDQRGVARPQGTACDIGAFEYESSQVTSANDALNAVDNDNANEVSYDITSDYTWHSQYTYDLDDAGDSENLKGRLYKIETNNDGDTEADVTQTYVYDVNGRVTAMALWVDDYDDDDGVVVFYDYDQLGNITTLGPGDVTVDSDNLRRLSSRQFSINIDADDSPIGGVFEALTDETITIDDNVTIEADAAVSLSADQGIYVGTNVTVETGATLDLFTGISSDRVLRELAEESENTFYYYNTLGQLEKIGTGTDDDYYAAYTYNSDGSIATESLNDNTLTRTYTYDFRGMLLSMEDATTDSTIFKEVLSYKDSNGNYLDGNIQFATCTGTGIGTAFQYVYSYDELGRLTSALTASDSDQGIDAHSDWDVGSTGQDGITYDANGNIQTLARGGSSYSYSYNEATNRIEENSDGSETTTYQYDENGSITGTSDISAVTYQPFTQMVSSITTSANATSFDYNGHGQRILKQSTANDVTTAKRYVRGLGAYPLLEGTRVDSGDESVFSYVYGPTGLVAVNDGRYDYFILKDHLGSTRVVVEQDNTVTSYFNYFPFGSLNTDNCSNDRSAPSFTYRYTGQEYDDETGLYNYRARLYDTELGRFYKTDPVTQLSSPYAYVSNNPIMYADPTGMIPRTRGSVRQALSKGNQTTRYVRKPAKRLKSPGYVRAEFNGKTRTATYYISKKRMKEKFVFGDDKSLYLYVKAEIRKKYEAANTSISRGLQAYTNVPQKVRTASPQWIQANWTYARPIPRNLSGTINIRQALKEMEPPRLSEFHTGNAKRGQRRASRDITTQYRDQKGRDIDHILRLDVDEFVARNQGGSTIVSDPRYQNQGPMNAWGNSTMGAADAGLHRSAGGGGGIGIQRFEVKFVDHF